MSTLGKKGWVEFAVLWKLLAIQVSSVNLELDPIATVGNLVFCVHIDSCTVLNRLCSQQTGL